MENSKLRRRVLIGLCSLSVSISCWVGEVPVYAAAISSGVTATTNTVSDEGPLSFTARIQRLLDNYHAEYNRIRRPTTGSKESVPPAGDAVSSAKQPSSQDTLKAPIENVQSPATSHLPADDSRYSFDWQGTPIAQSLYAVAKIAQRDVVVNGSLTGNVYMSLHDVTCEQAMDFLSRAFNFNWSADDNAILISPADVMKPSEVFRVHYANKEKLREELKSLGIEEKNIYANVETGTISVTGTPYQLREAAKRIKEIDHPVSQCLIVAQLIEISHGDELNLGMQYTLPTYTHTAGSGSSGSSFFGGNVIDKLTFSASSSANKALSKGRVISRPLTMILNGHEGNVSFGDQVPVLKKTTSTTSTDITVEYHDVGTKLIVTPIIDTDTNEISMTINAERSNISKWITSGETTAPQIAVRKATTSAHLRSGQSFVIGGLMSVSALDNLSGIPGLMNLPILGKLFSYHSKSKTYAEVYIMITPYIVTDDIDPQGLLHAADGLQHKVGDNFER